MVREYKLNDDLARLGDTYFDEIVRQFYGKVLAVAEGGSLFASEKKQELTGGERRRIFVYTVPGHFDFIRETIEATATPEQRLIQPDHTYFVRYHVYNIVDGSSLDGLERKLKRFVEEN